MLHPRPNQTILQQPYGRPSQPYWCAVYFQASSSIFTTRATQRKHCPRQLTRQSFLQSKLYNSRAKKSQNSRKKIKRYTDTYSYGPRWTLNAYDSDTRTGTSHQQPMTYLIQVQTLSLGVGHYHPCENSTMGKNYAYLSWNNCFFRIGFQRLYIIILKGEQNENH